MSLFGSICTLCCERNRQKKNLPHQHVKFAGAVHSDYSDDSHTAGSSRGTMSDGKSFMDSFVPTSFARNSDFMRGLDTAEYKKKMREIEAQAKKLEGPVQKFPRSGKGLFKKMQERYIAVIPGEHASSTDDDGSEFGLWKTGQLAYWEDALAYKHEKPPKGSVGLLKIAKVWVSKDDSRNRSVVVKHKRNDEMQELVLCFDSKRNAEEWSYKLWEFISMLRGQGHAASI